MCIFWEVDEPSDGPPHPYPRELLLLLQMLQWKGWRNGGEQTAELLPRKDFAGQKRQGEELPFFGGNANLKRPLASNAWQPSLLSPLLSVQTSGGITCAGGSGSNFRSWFRINLIYSLISCGGKKEQDIDPRCHRANDLLSFPYIYSPQPKSNAQRQQTWNYAKANNTKCWSKTATVLRPMK